MRTIRIPSHYGLPDNCQHSKAGFARFTVTDSKRKGAGGTMHRCFEVLVWYPAEPGFAGKSKPYLAPYQLKKRSWLNIAFGSSKRKLLSEQRCPDSIEGAPLSESKKRYPVLLFSHDLGKLPEHYTTLMEQIAREGYFIFSINHPGLAEVSLVNDEIKKRKRTIYANTLLNLRWRMTFDQAKTKLVGKSYEQKWSTSRQLLANWRQYHSALSVMEADRSALLSFLQAISAARYYPLHPYDLFVQRLDLSHVGAIGHGWGGASAVDSLVNDYRIRAAINLDGLQFSNAMNHMINKPLYAIYSNDNAGMNDGIYFNASTNEKYTIANADSSIFLDSRTAKATLGVQQSDVVAQLCTKFMDRFLKTEPSFEPESAPIKKMTIL